MAIVSPYGTGMVQRRKPVNLPNDSRGVLARNVEALMNSREDRNSQPKVAERAGMAQSTVGRILRAEVWATLENIDGLAKAFRVQPWQLLTPNLDPQSMPQLLTSVTPQERFRDDVLDVFRQVLEGVAERQHSSSQGLHGLTSKNDNPPAVKNQKRGQHEPQGNSAKGSSRGPRRAG